MKSKVLPLLHVILLGYSRFSKSNPILKHTYLGFKACMCNHAGGLVPSLTCWVFVSGNGLATVGYLFGYLQMLRRVGPQRWVFDELAAISNLKFRFTEEEDACEYVSRLAADMPHYAPEHALCGPHLYENWKPSLVSTAHARCAESLLSE